MEALLWALAGSGIATALLAMRRSSRLSEEIKRLKREQYDTGGRLRQIAEEIREAVEPLRVHLAKVARGGTVPPEMILNGRLYLDVSAFEAQRMLEEAAGRDPKTVALVDVRTPREYAIKRLAGARLVPFEELDQRYRTDIPDDAERILVYCASGERSRLACDFLARRGYTNLYHIRDGIQAWRGQTEGEGPVSLVQIERKT
jgi:rhodanese-related sulfurtransferase